MTREEAIYKANHLRKVHPSICIDAEDFWKTVIAALEQEPKTGRWIKDEITERSKAAYKHKCDLCGAYHRAMYDYCPSCGAKMQ